MMSYPAWVLDSSAIPDPLGYGERVVVVEDVVTTGKSTMECAAAASSHGAEVVGVGAIIDRSGGKRPFTVPFANTWYVLSSILRAVRRPLR